jgi:LPS-assembly protein
VIEPIAQVILGPRVRTWQSRVLPNEDSLDLEFTDSNLFAFNRYPGLDRLEGGMRANIGMRAAWYLGGVSFDGIVGQSYRTETGTFPVDSGLNGNVSDIVARATVAPTDWLDVTYRTRMDHKNFRPRLAEAVTSVGGPKLRVSAGYVYSDRNPYALYSGDPLNPNASYFNARNEFTVGAASTIGNFRFSGFARRDVATQQMVAVGASGAYEDECYIFDVRFQRRYTSINNDHGATAVLFQMTFKPMGQLGFRAM